MTDDDHLFGFIDTTIGSAIELLDIKVFASKMASRTLARSASPSGALIAAAKMRALVVLPTAGATKEVGVGDPSDAIALLRVSEPPLGRRDLRSGEDGSDEQERYTTQEILF